MTSPHAYDPTDGLNPFAGTDIRWLLRVQAETRAESLFLVWRPIDGERTTWTYAEFLAEVRQVASGLQERGIRSGDRVCAFLDNCPEYMLLWFALAWIGAILVSVNARYTSTELRDVLDRTSGKCILTSASLLERTVAAIRMQSGGALRPRVLVADGVGQAIEAEEALCDIERFADVAGQTQTTDDSGTELEWSSPAGIQFTSGTTARPKAVVWTHANYLWGGKVSAAHEQLGSDDRHLVHMPLFHTNAQIYSVMASLWVGAAVILVPRFSASRFWAVAVEEKATWCSMTPFNVKALRAQPVPAHTFRAWGNAAVVPSWERRFGVRTVAWWGMTETVSHPVVSDVGTAGRPFSMGRPALEYGVRVRGDDGSFVPLGEGLLEVGGVRGVSLALGYLDDPEANEATWSADGWMTTGDRVQVHEDGCLTFVSRDQDMLKVGGENVSATEVERVIASVAGVEEVAVVGAPDPMYNEVAVAFVVAPSVPDAGREALVERVTVRCTEQLAAFKVPRAVRVVTDLPRAALDKVAKSELRKLAKTMKDGS